MIVLSIITQVGEEARAGGERMMGESSPNLIILLRSFYDFIHSYIDISPREGAFVSSKMQTSNYCNLIRVFQGAATLIGELFYEFEFTELKAFFLLLARYSLFYKLFKTEF